jgi:N-acyl-D-aspartate/D-glutamate deacylase
MESLMPESFDLIIRGGTIVDGSGSAPFVGDVAIRGEEIAAVGKVVGSAKEEVDATGKLVTPGFVDIHTHYDGAAIWEKRLIPSSSHGVTTVVMGNCGVGFAPCRPESRDRLVKLMEGIEDIPEIVLTEGLTWEWETYPEYLDAVEKRPHDINIASYLPHAALRVYVMGERASAGEEATPEDIVKMAEITREAMCCGAIGFGSSRSLNHRSSDGHSVPTLHSSAAELGAIAEAMAEAGHGVLQMSTDFRGFEDLDGEFALLANVARKANRRLSLPAAQIDSKPTMWRDLLTLVDDENKAGGDVQLQVLPRPVGVLLGLTLSVNPFVYMASYQAIADLPLDERLARMRDPEVRARILSDEPGPGARMQFDYSRIFETVEGFDYEPEMDQSIAARAEQMGVDPRELAYDILIKRAHSAALYVPFAGYSDGNLDVTLEMFRHPAVVPGLGDGGAHYGAICDASYSTHMLTHWTRDRVRGEKMPIAEAIHGLTRRSAMAVGLNDRGLLAEGYRADLNVIDHAAVKLHMPVVDYDLPGRGRRLNQDAEGYVLTVVNGEVVYRNGKPTGALPGRLIRRQQHDPALAMTAE